MSALSRIATPLPTDRGSIILNGQGMPNSGVRTRARRFAEGTSVLTDDELMVRGAGGDDEAFRLLVERWERPVFAFLDRMLGSTEEAQDVGQEAFLRVVQQAKRYRPEGQFKSWLFRIAGNMARSRLRRRKILSWVRFQPELHDHAAPTAAPDVEFDRERLRVALRAALAKLPDRQRQALLLQHYESMSYEQIAGVLGTTPRAVDSLLSRAKAALREELEDRGIE